MHLYENEKMKELSVTDLREKVDFYSMDMYGRIDNDLQNTDFLIKKAIAHSNFSVF